MGGSGAGVKARLATAVGPPAVANLGTNALGVGQSHGACLDCTGAPERKPEEPQLWPCACIFTFCPRLLISSPSPSSLLQLWAFPRVKASRQQGRQRRR